MTTTYDAIIIGTGQAGPSLARRLATSGSRVAIIERKLFGGTCVNTGCIPTKTMVASAYAAHLARRGSDFGFSIDGKVSVDMKAVKARKESVLSKSRDGLEANLKSTENITVYQGHARFQSPREVTVGSDTLAAGRIFINVGARAIIPDIAGLDKIPWFTNSSLLDIDFLPRHLVIVGGSYIGLEFAQMFRRFGSEVTILEMAPRLVPHEDEDISAAIQGILENEGHRRSREREMHRRLPRDRHRTCCWPWAADPTPTTSVSKRPASSIDDHGYIAVDDQLRTSVPGIWALGDCNGKGGFTHTSYNDFEIVAANLLDNDPRRVSDRIPTYALYIDPPLGRAGMTEAEVRATGRPALIGQRPMTKVGRAVEKGETQGFMKVLVDAQSQQILGAAILGTGGDEAIHCILDIMYAKAPYTVIQRAVHIHPTVSELIPTMLGELKPLE